MLKEIIMYTIVCDGCGCDVNEDSGYGGIINSLSKDARVGIGNYVETALTSETGWETLDINNYRIYDKCYKIIIPQEEPNYNMKQEILDEMKRIEEPKQETLEEAAENYYKLYQVKEGFIDGAKWQQERMYSEEEVLKLLKEFHFVDENYKTWFEQNKKK